MAAGEERWGEGAHAARSGVYPGICQGRRTARGDSREALQTIWQMLQMKGA